MQNSMRHDFEVFGQKWGFWHPTFSYLEIVFVGFFIFGSHHKLRDSQEMTLNCHFVRMEKLLLSYGICMVFRVH